MTTRAKKKPNTIDLTPEWPDVIRILFHVLRRVDPKKRQEHIDYMEQEITRLAVAYQKKLDREERSHAH